MYPALGHGSNSNFTIRPDGTTWGDGGTTAGAAAKAARSGPSGGPATAWAAADLTVSVPEAPGGDLPRRGAHRGHQRQRYPAPRRHERRNVIARGTRGSLSIDTGSGDVTVTGASGSLSLDTGSGDVEVSDMREGDLTVDTGSGEVRARDIAARTLAIDTGSGDIRVEGTKVPDATLEAGSGSIWISLTGTLARLHVETGSGDVTVRLPES